MSRKVSEVGMINKQKITEEIDELRNFLDVELHSAVSPDRWDIYSTLCDMVDELEAVVLDSLKEQEAVKPTWTCGKPFCGACGLQIRGGKFCSECGKPIAWEGR